MCMNVAAYACIGSRTQVATYVRKLKATLVILFPKIKFLLILKDYIFHFNTPQVNLISDWALNWFWALEFEHYYETRA